MGLVYLANSLPVLAVKAVGPFCFDGVAYKIRFIFVSIAFILAIILVISASPEDLTQILLGIAISSAAGGLGEPSALALAASLDVNLLSAFSSGTGFAGVFGYLWTLVLQEGIGVPPKISLGLAISLPIGLYLSYKSFIASEVEKRRLRSEPLNSEEVGEKVELLRQRQESEIAVSLEVRSRLRLMIYLKKYMMPLFLVYFAEYSMQSGVWAAIGFPITSEKAREIFYLRSNFLYQFGVLLSRSSTMYFEIPYSMVALMPILQILLLTFFIFNDIYFIFKSQLLIYSLCVVAGLFGGAVYANSFILVSRDKRILEKDREYAVQTTNLADTLGIIVADVTGVVIQICLYKVNSLHDTRRSWSNFSCPF